MNWEDLMTFKKYKLRYSSPVVELLHKADDDDGDI